MNVQREFAREPEWLTCLRHPDGFSLLETVQEFWRLPDLVRLLDSFRCQHYLNDADDLKLCWGFADDDQPMDGVAVTMSQHVFHSVELGPA